MKAGENNSGFRTAVLGLSFFLGLLCWLSPFFTHTLFGIQSADTIVSANGNNKVKTRSCHQSTLCAKKWHRAVDCNCTEKKGHRIQALRSDGGTV